MDRTKLHQKIADLLSSADAAHKLAENSSREEDQDWPIWYAEHLQAPLAMLFKQDFTRARLIYCLMSADFEYQAMATETETQTDKKIPWADYVARNLSERYAPADKPEQDHLALYHFETCPYCRKVQRVIDKLGLDVESRDISHSRKDYQDLLTARKRATVPVLRITSADGEDRWMPESDDIIRYLERNYASGQ